MKKNDERIIMYIDGQMSPGQIKDFEKELQSSETLRKELSEYKAVYKSISTAKEKRLNANYTESIIPEFRRRMEEKKSGALNTRFAYIVVSFILIASVIYLVNLLQVQDPGTETVVSFNQIENSDLDIALENMSTDDILLAYSDEDSNELDSILTAYFSETVTSAADSEENLFALNELDYLQIENLLSDEEVDLVYNEIINKVLF